MAELGPVFAGRVFHTGIFDFKELYKFLYEWLKDYQYLIIEKKYSEKIKSDGKEIEIEWMNLRKISDYFRFRIKMVTRVTKMVSVEVQEEGMKTTKDKGEIEIKFETWLEKDYENRWEENAIFKFLRGMYDKYIIKSRIEFYEDKLKDETDEYINQIKSFLVLAGKY